MTDTLTIERDGAFRLDGDRNADGTGNGTLLQGTLLPNGMIAWTVPEEERKEGNDVS